MTDALNRLIAGYTQFYGEYAGEKFDGYRKWAAEGQAPRIMMIACSDARVNPSIVTRAKLGDIFVVCNVANVVPPYRPEKGSHHSTSAALEFAVSTLGVEHIVIMGHSGCGGIRALINDDPHLHTGEYSFIMPWVEIIADARTKVADFPEADRYHACEREALKISLANLQTFPWIADRCREGKLATHAWYFDIPSGVIVSYDPKKDDFIPLLESAHQTG
jgi:carbonic anhydrase